MSSLGSNQFYCPHCSVNLARKTYLAHKRTYFDSESGSWIKRKKISATDDCFDALDFEESETDQVEVNIQSSTAPPIVEFDDQVSSFEQGLGEELQQDEDEFADVQTADFEREEDSDEEEDEEVWEDEDSEDDDDLLPELEDSTQSSRQETTLLTWLLIFVLRLQAKHYIPDSAINSLLKFLYAFLLILSRYSDSIKHIVSIFPKSVYRLRTYFKLSEEFTRYVVCRKCYSVYEIDACVERHGTYLTSKVCTHRTHPNARLSCQTLLLKTVKLLNGKNKLYPFKVYCYPGFQRSLQRLLLRPGFSDLCDHWRSSTNSSGMLRDIYDGQLWKDFQHLNRQPCLAARYTYAVMLNIDWFQPYKLTQSSVGAMYLTFMNLPYQERFKRENIILLGIIPGPCEPSRDINQYLRPFVKEMLQYSTGILMDIFGQKDKQTVRCILFGVACDLPAGRKSCGFLSHSATLGCTRCLKSFPGSVGCKDYSGFDREHWKLRTNSDHRASVKIIQRAGTKTNRDQLESKYGCRYSVLLELSYFDPVRMLIIDPMHNLFLGSAKHIIKKVWSSCNVLDLSDKQVCERIQSSMDSIHVPIDIGRIPRKIETGFSGLTADQYKNWVTVFSVPSLYGVIGNDDLECWRHFVLACRILCQRSLTVADVSLADGLLLQFCRRVQRLYGSSAITPNMHMHCHLKNVLLDYGPVYDFWLFSYERYNGILQHQPTSNRSIEIQLMRRFLQDNTAYALQLPNEFCDELGDLCTLKQKVTGSLLLMARDQSIEQSSSVELPSFYTHHNFSEDEHAMLKSALLQLHPTLEHVNTLYCRYKFVLINKTKLTSSTSKNTSIVMANWDSQNSSAVLPRHFAIPCDPLLRACKLNYFVKVSYSCEGELGTHCFAYVSWYEQHPSRFLLGKPVQLWCPDLFESNSFLSLHHTYLHRCAHSFLKLPHTEENVLAVVPCTV